MRYIRRAIALCLAAIGSGIMRAAIVIDGEPWNE